MPISPANSVTSSKPTWYVYDQFSFDPVAEIRHPNKELHLRRTEGPRPGGAGHPAERGASRLLSSELFSPDAPEPSDELQELGHYSYFYSNHRGDITSILKHDGQSLHSYVYEEYGAFYDTNQSKGNSSNFIDPHNAYTFNGKEFDRETGLMYFGARYLDPWSGTWNSQDIVRGSIHFPETMHRYAFVKNNPVNYVDPDGYCGYQLDGQVYAGPIMPGQTCADGSVMSGSTTYGLYGPTYLSAPPNPYKTIPVSIPTVTKFDTDWYVNYIDGIITAGGNIAVGVKTAENNYGLGASGDVAAGYNEDLGLVFGAGGAVNFQKDGQILSGKAGLIGTANTYRAFGYRSKQEYINAKIVELNDFVKATIKKAKDERLAKWQKLQEEMLKEAQRKSLWEQMEDFFTISPGPTGGPLYLFYGGPSADYIDRSWNQFIKGNYTDDVTLLGTGGQVATGFVGIDLPGDIRDIIADFDKWEWTWGHAGRTGFDVIGLLPVVGALKYSDEAASLAKSSKKGIQASEKLVFQLAKKLKFTTTTSRHMLEAGRRVPRHVLADAILHGKKLADPQNAEGAIKIVQEIFVNNKQRTLEIIYRESDNTILHFLYK